MNMAGRRSPAWRRAPRRSIASADYKGKAKDAGGLHPRVDHEPERLRGPRSDVLGQWRVVHAEHVRQGPDAGADSTSSTAYLSSLK